MKKSQKYKEKSFCSIWDQHWEVALRNELYTETEKSLHAVEM